MSRIRMYAQRVLLGLHAPAPDDGDAPDLAAQVGGFEAGVIRRTLSQTGGDVLATQTRLGLPRNTLYDKLKRYGVRTADYRRP